jgi:hypothetical protein
MAFEFKIEEKRKPPSEYDGSPFKALLAEISSFAKQHRKHGLRRFAGMDADEPESPEERMGHGSEEAGEYGGKPCPECEAGTCDNPEHMSEDDKSGLAKLLGE